MFSPPSIPDFDELLDFGPAAPDAEADAGAGQGPDAETAPPRAAGTPVIPAFAPAPVPTRTSAPAPEAAAPLPPPPAPAPTPAPTPAAMHAGPDGELDRVLGIVVDGVMEVLRARAEIKNTFRLPVTIIQRTENNPLKFAATPDEAIRKLMAPDNGAFLAGAAAFEDAFEDIRCHQVAMLAGMRAAFESLLFHFNPDRHEQEVDSSGKRAFAGKARYWERYRDNFETLVKDPDECFRRLFGDEFARAYEAQLARLKSSRRTRSR
jgi:type VI secretion system protein ImpI